MPELFDSEADDRLSAAAFREAREEVGAHLEDLASEGGYLGVVAATAREDLAREDAVTAIADPVGWVLDAVVDYLIDPVNREAVVDAHRLGIGTAAGATVDMADGRRVDLIARLRR